MKVAYIDEFKDRFGVGPVCRVLAESLDCGFLTPRGYRMFKSRPVSRMAARHEALARDIMTMHSDFFMAVYGYRKTHAQLIARGWDPTEVGRDQVMNIMRELGIQGVRRGKTPVTTRPAKGAGGRPNLVERKFEAKAPNRLHVADITYARMANCVLMLLYIVKRLGVLFWVGCRVYPMDGPLLEFGKVACAAFDLADAARGHAERLADLLLGDVPADA